MSDNINSRIRTLAQMLYNGNINEMCRVTGIKQATMSNIVAGRMSKPSYEVIYALIDKTGVDADWLIKGSGEPFVSYGREQMMLHYVPKSGERYDDTPCVKLYDIEAAANLNTLLDLNEQPSMGTIACPGMPRCDGAVHVRGESMYPLLCSGDIVLYKVVEPDVRNIIYGEMYLVSISLSGDEYLAVKYVQRSEAGPDWIKLVSHNPAYDPMDVHIADVRWLAVVKVSIHRHMMR